MILYSFHIRTNDDEKMEVSVGTAVLLDFLRNSYENCEFYFCLGGDSFIDLVQGKWQQTDRILNNLLLSQEGDESQPLSRRLLVLYRSVQHREDHDLLIRQYAKELGVRLIQISHLGNVSSTQVRNCDDIVQLQSSHQMILPQVLEYIQAHGLYQFCK
jgi:nicotinic acid mononucleotide adenylyltransferase